MPRKTKAPTSEQYRDSVDWERLFAEGMKVSAGTVHASACMAPGENAHHYGVLLIKAPRDQVERLMLLLKTYGQGMDKLLPMLDLLLHR